MIWFVHIKYLDYEHFISTKYLVDRYKNLCCPCNVRSGLRYVHRGVSCLTGNVCVYLCAIYVLPTSATCPVGPGNVLGPLSAIYIFIPSARPARSTRSINPRTYVRVRVTSSVRVFVPTRLVAHLQLQLHHV